MGGYRGNCEDTLRFECEIVSSMQWSATLNRQSLDAQLTKLVVYLVLLQEEVKRYRRESGDRPNSPRSDICEALRQRIGRLAFLESCIFVNLGDGACKTSKDS
jgi:hypothetical protein